MKPVDFNFERPASLTDALELMSRDDMNVVALAGGQSLLPMMNFRMVRPDILVDLNGLDELRGSEIGPDRARIGAMTRYSDLASNAELMARLPLLASALPHVANSAIRNRGTLGGSIAMADPTTEMPAVMLALGATIRLASRDGERSVAADDFYLGYYESALESGELVIAIDVPTAAPGDAFGFYEVARRRGDRAMAGAAIARRNHEPRIAFFSVSDRPVRGFSAERILGENAASVEAAEGSLKEIDFHGDLHGGPDLKRHLARIVLRRAWAELQP